MARVDDDFVPNIAVRAGCRSSLTRNSPSHVGRLFRCYSDPRLHAAPLRRRNRIGFYRRVHPSAGTNGCCGQCSTEAGVKSRSFRRTSDSCRRF